MTDETAIEIADAPERRVVPESVGVIVATEDLETLRAAVGPDLNNSELKLAVLYARRVGADLFARQIYPVKVDGRLTFITSIDFMRVIAQRSGEYAGQGRVEYGPDCTCEQEEVKLDTRRHPEWAEVPIFRKGFAEPVVRRAYFHEYAPLERPKEGPGWVIKYTWRKMPHVMVSKVSEALGIRVTFPNDMQGLYSAEEMEQAGVDGARPVQNVIDIPPEPELDAAFLYRGSVREAPDGIRVVKAPDWYHGLADEKGKVEKLEIATTINNRKHTAILMGPPHEPLITSVWEANIAADERIAFAGKFYEYEWAQGKPKAKQIRYVTRVAVLRENRWIELGVIEGEVAERLDADLTEALAEAAEAAPAGPTDSSASEAPSAASPSEAPPSTPTTPTSAEASTSATPPEDTSIGATETPDMTEAAEAIFEELLPDADVDPTRGGSAELDPDPMTFEVWSQPDGTIVDLENVAIIELVAKQTTASGKPYVDLWLRHPEAPARFHAFMQGDEAKAQGVYDMAQGQRVHIVGTWMTNAGESFVVLTAVTE